MRLLHIIPTVSADYGGPVAALHAADAATRERGVIRTVATLDLPTDPWIRQCSLAVVPLGSPRLRHARPAWPLLRYGFTPHLVPWLRQQVRRHDRVVVHGLWHYAALAARRVLPDGPVPYFVYPHGMLDPWFRVAAPWKHRAKQLSWWANEGALLAGAQAVLFTSEGEREAAAGAFRPYRMRGIVAGYGVGGAPTPDAAQGVALRAAVPGLGTRPFLLFLGRLHPKKGGELLLRALAATGDRLAGYHLVMAGPDVNGHAHDLRALAGALGIADRVHWPGMLDGAAKWGALHGCAAFVLPSHGENFGVAVAEALSCGRPVLLSHRVNIAAEVVAAGAGLGAPDTEAGTATLLESFAALPPDAVAIMSRRARACFHDRYVASRVADRTIDILRHPELFL